MNDLEKLADLVKKKLDITWSDADTDAEVLGIVQNAIPIMNHKLGVNDVDYSLPGLDRFLFVEFCKYCWNDYAHMFDEENRKDIIQARAVHGNV